MEYSILQFVVLVAVGVCVILFARLTYSRPEAVRQRHFLWLPELPNWSWSPFLRGLAAFWVFGGFMLIAQGVTGLSFVARYRGLKLLTVVTTVAVIATALVVLNTPRQERHAGSRRAGR